jgi:hypothetical protein
MQQHLMDTLAELRSGKIKPDQAKAIAHVSGVLVESAKVQVQYLQVTKQSSAGFFQGDATPSAISTTSTGTVERLPGRTIHRLGGSDD